MNDKHESLTEQTRLYLATCKGSWRDVAKETGIDIQWIYKFMGGGINDAGVSKIEKLIQHRDCKAA